MAGLVYLIKLLAMMALDFGYTDVNFGHLGIA
jgi:hypothetical protein